MMGHPVRFVAERLVVIVTVAMTFDIGLVDHVQTVLTRQFVPALRVRVMRIPYGIEIRSLHQADVGEHGFFTDDMSGDIVMLVQVGALEFDELAIDQKTSVDDLRGSKTDGLRDGLNAVDRNQQGVDVWRLGRPASYSRQERGEFVR